MKSQTGNPIKRTLAALALGAAILTSTQGCVSQRVGNAINQIGQAVDDMSGKRRDSTKDITTTTGWNSFIRNSAMNRHVQILSTTAEYAVCIERSREVPVILMTYSRFDNCAADSVLNFCNYSPSVAVDKRLIADDAAELEGIVGKILKNGQTIIILDKGKSYGCRLEELPAWVAAYQLAREKASANK